MRTTICKFYYIELSKPFLSFLQVFFKRLTFLLEPEAQSVFFKANDDQLTQQEVYDFMKPVFGPEGKLSLNAFAYQ